MVHNHGSNVTVKVDVIAARNLYDTTWVERQDPFVKVKALAGKKEGGKQKFYTTVSRNTGSRGKWNESFTFHFPEHAVHHAALEFSVYDHNYVSDDKKISECRVHLGSIHAGSMDKWVQLIRYGSILGKRKGGELHLKIKIQNHHSASHSSVYSSNGQHAVLGQQLLTQAYSSSGAYIQQSPAVPVHTNVAYATSVPTHSQHVPAQQVTYQLPQPVQQPVVYQQHQPVQQPVVYPQHQPIQQPVVYQQHQPIQQPVVYQQAYPAAASHAQAFTQDAQTHTVVYQQPQAQQAAPVHYVAQSQTPVATPVQYQYGQPYPQQ